MARISRKATHTKGTAWRVHYLCSRANFHTSYHLLAHPAQRNPALLNRKFLGLCVQYFSGYVPMVNHLFFRKVISKNTCNGG